MEWTATGVYRRQAVFEDRLEDEFVGEWPEMAVFAKKLPDEPGKWRPKSEYYYRQTSRGVEGEVPGPASGILAAVKSLS